LNSHPPSFFFIPPPAIPGIVSTGSHFSGYGHVYTVFAPYSPSYTLSHILPPTSTIPSPPDRIYSALLVSDFVKEKKTFLLFKITIQGVFLYVFMYMCII
jgi:hypothetical protein